MDTSVFLGALLGFIAGLGLDVVVTWWRRRERAQAHRRLIAIELLYNLRTMDDIIRTIQETRQTGYAQVKRPIATLRAEVLRSVITAGDALLSLTVPEQTTLMQVLGMLDRASSEYDDWPNAISGDRGLMTLASEDGSVTLGRDVATTQLLDTLYFVMRIGIFSLVMVLNNSADRSLSAGPLRAMRRALQPTRRRWRRAASVQVAVRTPRPGELSEEHRREPLVVWIHEEADYPTAVIELKSIAEGGDA
jgi:hypothetical protein